MTEDVVMTALKSGASRREVMGWLMAAGATLTAAGSVVTGATKALAATPKKGGSIRFAWDLHGPSDTLDPILFTSSLDYGRGRMNYNSLTRFNPDLTVEPEIGKQNGKRTKPRPNGPSRSARTLSFTTARSSPPRTSFIR